MTQQQFLINLQTPDHPVDVILDTDAYNEIDDQFAISYLLGHPEKLRVQALCAAPFFNPRSVSPEDGMEKSYQEIKKLLELTGKTSVPVYEGSRHYLTDETTPVESPAADYMAQKADSYSPEKPLYIVAIGAITNVASAILKNPRMTENCVIVWLGGNALQQPLGASEFNMVQDIAAARVIFGCGAPVVQLPVRGGVDHFATSQYELEHWLKGKNALCDYLYESTVQEANSYAAGKPWTRVLWDVTAVAWLLNDHARFMNDRLVPAVIPEYDRRYAVDGADHRMNYVYAVNRDALYEDLFNTLAALNGSDT